MNQTYFSHTKQKVKPVDLHSTLCNYDMSSLKVVTHKKVFFRK